MNKSADRPVYQSTEANAEQPLRVPHPFQNLSGIRVYTKPISQDVYDHILKRGRPDF